ncbi:hypothetical protein V5O48_016365, partial [Marasmius crinis-equi]
DIGDVGIFSDELPFNTLFNITQSLDSVANRDGVPGGVDPPCVVQDRWLTVDDKYHPDETTLIRPEGSILHQDVQEGKGPRIFTFELSQNGGALLMLPRGGSLRKLERITELRKRVQLNWREWCEFADDQGDPGDQKALYVVTGVGRCSTWAMAAWDSNTNYARDRPGSLELAVDGSTGICSWRFPPARCSTQSSTPASQSADDQPKETVFVRGFWVNRSDGHMDSKPPPVRSGKDRDDKGDEGDADHDERDAGYGNSENLPGNGASSSNSSFSARPPDDGKTSGSSKGPSDSERLQVDEFQLSLSACDLDGDDHPCQVINKFALALVSKAHPALLDAGCIALSHDDDWMSIVQDVCSRVSFQTQSTDFFLSSRKAGSVMIMDQLPIDGFTDAIYTASLSDLESQLVQERMSSARNIQCEDNVIVALVEFQEPERTLTVASLTDMLHTAIIDRKEVSLDAVRQPKREHEGTPDLSLPLQSSLGVYKDEEPTEGLDTRSSPYCPNSGKWDESAFSTYDPKSSILSKLNGVPSDFFWSSSFASPPAGPEKETKLSIDALQTAIIDHKEFSSDVALTKTEASHEKGFRQPKHESEETPDLSLPLQPSPDASKDKEPTDGLDTRSSPASASFSEGDENTVVALPTYGSDSTAIATSSITSSSSSFMLTPASLEKEKEASIDVGPSQPPRCDMERLDGNSCRTCKRLTIECLGWGPRRPEWMRNKQAVDDYKASIKAQLTRKGLVRGQPRSSMLQAQAGAGAGTSTPAPRRTQQRFSANNNSTGGNDNSTGDNSSTSRDFDGWGPTVAYEPTSGEFPTYFQSSLRSTTGLLFSPESNLNTPPISGPSSASSTHSLNLLTPASGLGTGLGSNVLGSGLGFNGGVVLGMGMGGLGGGGGGLDLGVGGDLQNSPKLPILSGQHSIQETHVMYYFENIRRVHFVLSNNAVMNATFELIVQDPRGALTNAVCALASLHYTRLRVAQGLEAPDPNPEHSTAKYFYDEAYFQLVNVKQIHGGNYTETDALAALHLVYFSQLSGGLTDWRPVLSIALDWIAQSGLPNDHSPEITLRMMGMAGQMSVKCTMTIDIISSLTLMRPPEYFNLYQRLLSQTDNNMLLQPGGMQMEFLTGCPDEAWLTIAETSVLSVWKTSEERKGSLSFRELVRRGDDIERRLRQHMINTTFHSTDPPQPHNPYLASDPALPTEDVRRLVARIFRETAVLFLHTVVNNPSPSIPEINNSVDGLVGMIRQLAPSDIDRTLVFPICLAGCMTDNSMHRDFLKGRLQAQDETIGNIMGARFLMEGVWQRRDVSGNHVDFREMMRERGVDLLLM